MPNMLTPEGVLSYPKLFVPVYPKTRKPDSVRSYEVSVLFTQEQVDTAEYKALVAECERVGRERFGDKFDLLFQDGKLKWPFRKDIASSGYPAKFVRFIGARAAENPMHPAPQIVARDGKTKITSALEVYPGVRARISVSPFAFDNESKGVSLGLRNVQILGKGDRLTGDGVEPGTEFGGLAPEAAGDMKEDVQSMLG